ncbi:hypothetical protein [Vibrio rotiferianus]|uniref:hypothetical protein n=1 Tax=Vibrio rotiferianus TaxID=190895 RepID=UPI00406A1CA2
MSNAILEPPHAILNAKCNAKQKCQALQITLKQFVAGTITVCFGTDRSLAKPYLAIRIHAPDVSNEIHTLVLTDKFAGICY